MSTSLGKLVVLEMLCACIRGEIFLDVRAFAVEGKGRYGVRAMSKATINEGIEIGSYDTSGELSWNEFHVPHHHPVSKIPEYINRNESIKDAVRNLLVMTIGITQDAFRSTRGNNTGDVLSMWTRVHDTDDTTLMLIILFYTDVVQLRYTCVQRGEQARGVMMVAYGGYDLLMFMSYNGTASVHPLRAFPENVTEHWETHLWVNLGIPSECPEWAMRLGDMYKVQSGIYCSAER